MSPYPSGPVDSHWFSSHRPALLAALFGLCLVGALQAQVKPLPNAHAHNDYEHPRPLLDALDRGFCSVEADVYRVDGDLWVAHDRKDLKPERTLKSLYLDPLLKRVRSNQGKVYGVAADFYLMIDFKTGAESTYEILQEQLKPYREMLTEYGPNGIQQRAVTVVISGNRPTRTLADQQVRLAFIDGRLKDLKANESPATLIPWISENWRNHFKWDGRGAMTEAESEKLQTWIEQAHAQDRKVRFWATPETELFWRTAYASKLDFINTDQLEALQKVLLSIDSQ